MLYFQTLVGDMAKHVEVALKSRGAEPTTKMELAMALHRMGVDGDHPSVTISLRDLITLGHVTQVKKGRSHAWFWTG